MALVLNSLAQARRNCGAMYRPEEKHTAGGDMISFYENVRGIVGMTDAMVRASVARRAEALIWARC